MTNEPAAWKFVNPDGSTRFILDDPKRVAAWLSANEGEVVPLYAALTDAEREAIGVAIQCVEAARAQRHPEEDDARDLLWKTTRVLRGLLDERTK